MFLKKLKFITWLIDWYDFGKHCGFIFAFKYKTGRAKEGIDFFSAGYGHSGISCDNCNCADNLSDYCGATLCSECMDVASVVTGQYYTEEQTTFMLSRLEERRQNNNYYGIELNTSISNN
jgi:hypothetical protein